MSRGPNKKSPRHGLENRRELEAAILSEERSSADIVAQTGDRVQPADDPFRFEYFDFEGIPYVIPSEPHKFAGEPLFPIWAAARRYRVGARQVAKVLRNHKGKFRGLVYSVTKAETKCLTHDVTYYPATHEAEKKGSESDPFGKQLPEITRRFLDARSGNARLLTREGVIALADHFRSPAARAFQARMRTMRNQTRATGVAMHPDAVAQLADVAPDLAKLADGKDAKILKAIAAIQHTRNQEAKAANAARRLELAAQRLAAKEPITQLDIACRAANDAKRFGVDPALVYQRMLASQFGIDLTPSPSHSAAAVIASSDNNGRPRPPQGWKKKAQLAADCPRRGISTNTVVSVVSALGFAGKEAYERGVVAKFEDFAEALNEYVAVPFYHPCLHDAIIAATTDWDKARQAAGKSRRITARDFIAAWLAGQDATTGWDIVDTSGAPRLH